MLYYAYTRLTSRYGQFSLVFKRRGVAVDGGNSVPLQIALVQYPAEDKLVWAYGSYMGFRQDFLLQDLPAIL